MIKITIYRDSVGNYKEFQVSGHAGSSEYGTDIVCASISVLTISTVNSIERLTGDKFSLTEDEEAGMIDVVFECEISQETKLLMDSFALGVTEISKEYGTDYVKVIFKEV